MGMLKPWHIIVLVVVILLLFGARRLPDLARSVGQSLKIFKSEVKDLSDDGKPNDSHVPPAGTTSSTGTPASTPPSTTPAAPSSTTPASGTGSSQVPGLVDPNNPRA
ncbi:Sec-independent protein translocase subunit TatA [Puerhibacterium puerhi]|uniref:Sec-independent protein translocase subunit TatA n=1 Tax=Puerhibacterium puerhi TaxID=2692623 RepID=UPI00135CD217|nr:Sec-independent protein translocase subunit TatA [Puerhibacterium puerhi]